MWHVEVRGKVEGVDSLLPLVRAPGIELGFTALAANTFPY